MLMMMLIAGATAPLFNDSHVHLTNYVQEGISAKELVTLMGDKVGRATLFGIPLQQQWAFENTGDFAPTYYLQTDAPLYYYSFTDAQIAMAYRALSPQQRARLDPLITGFNPTDMYAVDHIKRVMLTFPGVFEGLGEFTIHKEFVSSKVAGEVASLNNPALDRIFDFAAEVKFPVLLHCDADTPFPKPGQDPYLVKQLRDLMLRHKDTQVIWAHGGVGRVVRPLSEHVALLGRALDKLPNLYIDLSWSETAKYIVQSEETIAAMAELVNRHPDRFLFGTDEVAPTKEEAYLSVYRTYAPFLARLNPTARANLLTKNYERIFDAARRNARAWEAKHAGKLAIAP